MNTGIVGEREIIVDESMTAKKLGSGTLDVLATPKMISLIEETAWRSVEKELDSGMASVGTKLEIEHLSATPIGMKVFCVTRLVEIDNRKLVFEVDVKDEKSLIGKGIHERFIVYEKKFFDKANSKLDK